MNHTLVTTQTTRVTMLCYPIAQTFKQLHRMSWTIINCPENKVQFTNDNSSNTTTMNGHRFFFYQSSVHCSDFATRTHSSGMKFLRKKKNKTHHFDSKDLNLSLVRKRVHTAVSCNTKKKFIKFKVVHAFLSSASV